MISQTRSYKLITASLLLAGLSACASNPPSQSYGQSSDYNAPVRCYECGTVERIEAIQVTGQSTGGGAVLGGIVGGVIGNQFGRGDGKKAATVVGVVGGAVAGNAIEKNSVKHDYRISVRMDDGRHLSFTQGTISSNLREGSYVRIDNDRVVLLR